MKLRQLHGATLLLATLMMITEYNQLSAQFVATFDINPSSNMNQKFLQTKEGDPVNVILNLQQSFSTIGKRFLGVTIDTSLARNGMKTFNFSSSRVQALARALTPCFLRFGGTSADCMTFEPSLHFVKENYKESNASDGYTKYVPDLSNFTMPASVWDRLNAFAQTVGWDFIMDLNALHRHPDGSWDPTNAAELLQYSSARNYSIAGFELGNEYDLYPGGLKYNLSARQLAKDVQTLQKLLSSFPLYSSSFIIGPETAGLNPEYFMRWLDKLGLCAELGVEVVLRQTFFDLNYALIDHNFDPNPDFWLTLLFKRLIWGPVFMASGRDDVRVYAACGNTEIFSAGALVVYLLNPNNYTVDFDLPQFPDHQRLLYILTPGDEDGLLSKFSSLNGVKLEMRDDTLPPLNPVNQQSGSHQAETLYFVPASFLNLTVPADAKVREPVTLQVSLQQSLNTIGPHFLSVTLDTHLVQTNWSTFDLKVGLTAPAFTSVRVCVSTFDFRSTKVKNLAHALSPSYLRLGGTMADSLYFQSGISQSSHEVEEKNVGITNRPQFNMTAEQFDDINLFACTVGWDFIMDLNVLTRFPNDSWNPSNARELLRYGSEKNYSIVGFQLGNVLSLLVQRQQQTENFFQSFLADGGAAVVKASSLHQYYMGGHNAVLKDYIDVAVMNRLVPFLQSALSQTRSVLPGLPLWLTETSSSSSGGTPNVADRFVAGFLWLDKLGVSSTMGVEAVFRQDFYGSNYGLLDSHLNPNPDYWLTLLFKRLVRGPVFNVTGASDVRVYAACANPDSTR
ncbi:hypothetical protein C0Q70_02574 [Pomacea canaliculata]|uniref:Heparanase n=1 Tax=Pomacea canaliculata TaxID=400727 RepID=A0A2T7PQA8_POMCA|nr:hypothetical protein C0Q70_02574 [Pomacea canaliculata]